MPPVDRRTAVQEYVRERLRKETEPRGVAAKISKATGITPAHISNMTQTPNPSRDPGDEVMHKLAEYWGMTYGQLEDEALGAHRSSDLYADLPEQTVDVDERYPARRRAAVAARLVGISEAAIQQVLIASLDADDDPSERWWFDEMARVDSDMKDPFRRRLGVRPPNSSGDL